MLKKELISGIIIIILILLIFSYQKFYQLNVFVNNNLEVQINEKYKVTTFIKKIKNGKLVTKKDISFDKLGKNSFEIIVKNKFNKKKTISVNVVVKDTIPPVIKYNKEITTTINKDIDLLKNVTASDNSSELIKVKVEGNYNIKKSGTYKLKYVASDSSNNTSKEDFVLIVKDNIKKKKVQSNIVVNYKNNPKTTINKNINNTKPYYIVVNKLNNVVIVYGKDANNEYTNVVKTFVASVGLNNATPSGVFKTTKGYRWGALFGGVYGQYSTRIVGHILFHSVPYYSMNNNDLEWEEYNKLGTAASMGCIRLSVRDAKWIFDNISVGTTVEINDNALPAGIYKPSAIKIDGTSENRGWDPTDPDPNNPWNN